MHCCCNDEDRPTPARVSSSSRPAHSAWGRRMAGLIQWAFPITTLILIPKCPMCLAAYVLLFTGVGVSLPVAAAVRWALLTLCVGTLSYLVLRVARRALAAAG
jgi:hypothetical protein